MNFKDKVEVISSFATMTALVVGGVWTYNIFIKERQHYPHANVEHKINHVPLSPCANLLRVGVEVTNSGTSTVLSGKAVIWVQKVRPVSPCKSENEPCVRTELAVGLADPVRKTDRFNWPLLAYREYIEDAMLELEPNEKEEQDYEFIIPSSVEVVRIYSYYRNDRKGTADDSIGWRTSSYYELKTDPKERAKCKRGSPL